MENIAFGFLLINLLYIVVILLVAMFFYKRTKYKLQNSSTGTVKSRMFFYKIVYSIAFTLSVIIFFYLADKYFVLENIFIPLFLVLCMIIILKLQKK